MKKQMYKTLKSDFIHPTSGLEQMKMIKFLVVSYSYTYENFAVYTTITKTANKTLKSDRILPTSDLDQIKR